MKSLVAISKNVLMTYFVIMGFFVALYLFVSLVNFSWFVLSASEVTFWCRFALASAIGITILKKYLDKA